MLRKQKIAIALSVFGVLVVIIVIVAVILGLAIASIPSGNYGLLHKKGEDVKLIDNKTYTPGMKWAGIGNTFHMFEDKGYDMKNGFYGSYENGTELVSFNVSVVCKLIPDKLSEMWYTIYTAPAIGPITNITYPFFKNYLDNVLEYERAISFDPNVISDVDNNCCNEFKNIIKEKIHIESIYCKCEHGKIQ